MKKLVQLIFILLLSSKPISTQSQQITSEKKQEVVILDSIKGNAIINVILRGQVSEARLNMANVRILERNNIIKKLQKQEELSCKMLDLSEHRNFTKDSIIVNKDKIITRAKRKVSFWKYLSMGLSGLLIYQSIR